MTAERIFLYKEGEDTLSTELLNILTCNNMHKSVFVKWHERIYYSFFLIFFPVQKMPEHR